MKGYVEIEVSEDFKDKLFELVNKINEFNRKGKSEVVVFEPSAWWKFVYEDKYIVSIPEELEPYFDVNIYDKKHYYFYKTEEATTLGDLYHLILAGNPVYLGEQLARVYNKLKKGFEIGNT